MLLLGDLLRRCALSRPNKTAVIFEETRLTFGELNERVNRLANALTAMGVKRGRMLESSIFDEKDFYAKLEDFIEVCLARKERRKIG